MLTKTWLTKRARSKHGPRPRPRRKKKEVALEAEKELKAWMTKECLKMIKKMGKVRGAKWFMSPADHHRIKLGLPNYKPMDLGRVRSNLRRGLYDKTPTRFAADVKLVFDNAQLFKPKGHKIHDLAGKIWAKFEKLYFPFYQEYDQRRRGLMGDEEKNAVREWMKGWLVATMAKVEVVSMLKEHNPDMILNEELLVLDWGLLDRGTLMELDRLLPDRQPH